jgi:hypothetical protein
MAEPFVIDFGKFEGRVYTGRDRGERLRAELRLDDVDAADQGVVIVIPDTTYSISSSFFLGLFGPSVVRFGSRNEFFEKYQFQANDFFRGIINGHVERALQERNLFD